MEFLTAYHHIDHSASW